MSTGSTSSARVPGPDSPEPTAAALSEEQSHGEHRAALEATLFEKPCVDDELVFELEGGQLRLHARER